MIYAFIKGKRAIFFLGFVMILSYLGMGIDSIKNPNTIAKYLFLSSRIWFAYFILINLCFRLFFKIKLAGVLNKINSFFVLPFTALLTVVLTIIDYFTPDNFVFNRILVNYQQLGVFALGSLIISVINTDFSWLRRYCAILIFGSGFLLLFSLFIVRLWPMDVFLHMVQEDNLIENSQFAALLISAILSFYIAWRTFSFNKILSVLYLFCGLGLFLVAGDEISWGQRIFKIVSPEYIAEHNVQDEINIHNLDFFNNLVGYLYILVGFYGAFSWLFFAPFVKKTSLKLLSWIMPQWFLWVYFFFGFLYNFGVMFLHIYSFGEWSEVAELTLDVGVLFFIISIVLRLYNKRLKTKLVGLHK